ncbi:MAG: hypothetical protein NT001_06615 [Candidatus Woesearchaeota archaeon]|nr:hypothetical protein [Candidatus Woesearchaeota archaeon]
MADKLIGIIQNEFGPEYKVVSFESFGKEKVKEMKKAGVNADNTLVVSCVCRDDILHRGNHLTEYFDRKKYGVFYIGGLMGFPTGGVTGLIAASHHVPEGKNRHLLIVYGPHIGVSSQGEFGKVKRRGHYEDTSDCGALMGFLKTFQHDAKPGRIYMPPKDQLDLENCSLQAKFIPHMRDVIGSANSVVSLTKLAYDLIEDDIFRIVERARGEMHDMKIMELGAIFVNGPDGKDYLCIKHKE